MKALHALASTILVSCLAGLPALAQHPGASTQADMQLTAAGRQQVIDSLSREVEQRYVFPDKAKELAASLRARQKSGAYEGIGSARQLSEVLSQEMQTASKDRHLRGMFSASAGSGPCRGAGD